MLLLRRVLRPHHCSRLSTMAVEVEFKFPIAPSTRQRLQEMGATKKSSCTFTDTYYDTRSSVLMLSNHWLRRRDGRWQMKFASLESRNSQRESDAFNELEGQEVILSHLKTATASGKIAKPEWQVSQSGAEFPTKATGHETAANRSSAPSMLADDEEADGGEETFYRAMAAAKTLDEIVTAGTLIPVVEYSTTRESYVCRGREGEEVCVDLDQASFGYAVGEVEVLVQRWEDVPEARERTRAIARQLGE